MEANYAIIEKMLEEHRVKGGKDAKEAIINFSTLFAEKLVRTCMQGKPPQKKINTEEIRQAY
jgi:hypothetical protein